MERSVPRGLQHVGLPTACTLVYHNITGETLDARDALAMRSVLDDVAHALASIVPIYARYPDSGVPQVISPAELAEGRFSRGGHLFVAKGGTQLRRLSVQRADLGNAIAILKATGVRFRRPPNE